jgi:hypothetical protein
VIKVIRLSYLLFIVLALAVFLIGVLRGAISDEPDAIILLLWLSSIFLFPFIEVPLLLVCVWGAFWDNHRRTLYLVTGVVSLLGLVWAYSQRNTPLP